MSREEKLIKRFLSSPNDFTWKELVRLLGYFGYSEFKGKGRGKGKGNGSRRKFVSESKHLILLHEPHPRPIVKKGAMKDIMEKLKEEGLL